MLQGKNTALLLKTENYSHQFQAFSTTKSRGIAVLITKGIRSTLKDPLKKSQGMVLAY